jgi:hypothetical protein
VTAGRWDDRRPRWLYRTVTADNDSEATAALVAFVHEMHAAQQPSTQEMRDLTIDDAIERFLAEYLGDEKGRATKTISDYRMARRGWLTLRFLSSECVEQSRSLAA